MQKAAKILSCASGHVVIIVLRKEKRMSSSSLVPLDVLPAEDIDEVEIDDETGPANCKRSSGKNNKPTLEEEESGFGFPDPASPKIQKPESEDEETFGFGFSRNNTLEASEDKKQQSKGNSRLKKEHGKDLNNNNSKSKDSNISTGETAVGQQQSVDVQQEKGATIVKEGKDESGSAAVQSRNEEEKPAEETLVEEDNKLNRLRRLRESRKQRKMESENELHDILRIIDTLDEDC